MDKKLRICIDARIYDGEPGGLQQVVIGLANQLSKFESSREEYSFLCYKNQNKWLKPYIGNCDLVYSSKSIKNSRNKIIATINNFMRCPHNILNNFREATGTNRVCVPKSEGIIEKANIDIMHFTIQGAFLTKVPSIYQPHDLQHLHYPKYFSRGAIKWREKLYRKFCERAEIVIAMTKWGKKDLISNFGLNKKKVRIVPWAPIISEYKKPSPSAHIRIRQKYQIYDDFIFYPAQTWKHKNHLKLIEALSILKQKYGTAPKLICSGRINDFYKVILQKIRKNKLENYIKFTGFVSTEELQCLYRLCKFLVFPSKFEGWGLPITEAFYIGVPVTCSNVTCLPDIVGDSALLFDPENPGDIADSIWRLYSSKVMRVYLAKKGKERVNFYSWENTAKIFRAQYRKIAKRKLTYEDKELLFQDNYV